MRVATLSQTDGSVSAWRLNSEVVSHMKLMRSAATTCLSSTESMSVSWSVMTSEAPLSQAPQMSRVETSKVIALVCSTVWCASSRA